MTPRPNSIRFRTLKIHVNEYCDMNNVDYSYNDMDKYLKNAAELGAPINAEWLRSQFENQKTGGILSAPTLEKWLTVYREENNGS